MTALLNRDPDAVILAEHDGELIGSIIAGWDDWRCHLYRLAVRPAWRRQGCAIIRTWTGRRSRRRSTMNVIRRFSSMVSRTTCVTTRCSFTRPPTLAVDPQFGKARQMIVYVLWRFR